MSHRLRIATNGRGFYSITEQINGLVQSTGVRSGVLIAFVLHTSVSLVVQEKADPTSQGDMERFMVALGEQIHYDAQHIWESPEDSMSHVRSVLTGNSQTFIIADGKLLLGPWQGVFLWEHRHQPTCREVAVKIIADT